MKQKNVIVGLLIVALVVLYVVSHTFANKGSPKYITWEGLEPDKWASIWLIKKHISPDSKIEIRPTHARTDDGIAFDVPGAPFYRNAERSTYQSLLDASVINDSIVTKIGRIIYDMDVNVWADKKLPETPVLEHALRTLQQQYDRTNVPVTCYVNLFEKMYRVLVDNKTLTHEQLSVVSEQCPQAKQIEKITRNANLVTEVPLESILDEIKQGKKILFVDTRESAEFAERHIPGSINIKLREVNASLLPHFQNADRVIAYCVKDFRGYEVALALHKIGVSSASIMRPYGIRGWIDWGLPVAGDKALSEANGLQQLQQCATQPETCQDL